MFAMMPLTATYYWNVEPLTMIIFFLLAWSYTEGSIRLYSRSRWKGLAKKNVVCYYAGWAIALLALISPIHTLGETFFSAHMVQHELLMVVAAPLLVLGRPGPVYLSSIPKKFARAIAATCHSSLFSATLNVILKPASAFVIHAVALWLWHLPALFQRALTSQFVHWCQHASFFFTALLFWWVILLGKRRRSGGGMATVYLFLTALETGLLGALLTFSKTPWYYHYGGSPGLTALDDQQLGGLIMWVPGGVTYVLAALYLFSGWLAEARKKSSELEDTAKFGILTTL